MLLALDSILNEEVVIPIFYFEVFALVFILMKILNYTAFFRILYNSTVHRSENEVDAPFRKRFY